MGYSAKTYFVYGVELKPSEAKEFVEDLGNILILMGSGETQDMELYEIQEACQQYLELDEIVILGEGADSRSDNCEWYDPNDDHLWGYSLGFEFGSLNEKIKPQWTQQWQYIVKPILDLSLKTPKPDKLTVAQTD